MHSYSLMSSVWVTCGSCSSSTFPFLMWKAQGMPRVFLWTLQKLQGPVKEFFSSINTQLKENMALPSCSPHTCFPWWSWSPYLWLQRNERGEGRKLSLMRKTALPTNLSHPIRVLWHGLGHRVPRRLKSPVVNIILLSLPSKPYGEVAGVICWQLVLECGIEPFFHRRSPEKQFLKRKNPIIDIL